MKGAVSECWSFQCFLFLSLLGELHSIKLGEALKDLTWRAWIKQRGHPGWGARSPGEERGNSLDSEKCMEVGQGCSRWAGRQALESRSHGVTPCLTISPVCVSHLQGCTLPSSPLPRHQCFHTAPGSSRTHKGGRLQCLTEVPTHVHLLCHSLMDPKCKSRHLVFLLASSMIPEESGGPWVTKGS